MKKPILLIIACMLLVSPYALAGHGQRGGDSGYHHAGLEEKFFHKAHFYLENQEELGLSEEQIAQIKSLKIDVKKNMIRQDAEVEILKIDIHSALWQDQPDVDAIHKLVDQKYDIKRTRAKTLVSSIVQLKGMLSAEQSTKSKEIWRANKG
ncbi:MAG: hypothetical protein Q8R76_07510 [Candidatus Omnitrophota bacterium]|nr:hypothetical protein [Candidatus Omnitrophota bacterium]